MNKIKLNIHVDSCFGGFVIVLMMIMMMVIMIKITMMRMILVVLIDYFHSTCKTYAKGKLIQM